MTIRELIATAYIDRCLTASDEEKRSVGWELSVADAIIVALDTGGFVVVERWETACGWIVDNHSNGLAIAAQHHDRTGHLVRVEVGRTIYYGEANPGDHKSSYLQGVT